MDLLSRTKNAGCYLKSAAFISMLFSIALFSSAAYSGGWSIVHSGGKPLFDITFSGDSIGWAVGYNHSVLKTMDGGNKWDSITPQLAGTNLIKIVFFNKDTGIAVIENDLALRKTIDGGKTWNWLTTAQAAGNTNYLTSLFYDRINNVFYCAGIKGSIIKSFNHGLSWTLMESGVVEDFAGISFLGSTGFVVGKNNTIRKSINSGLSWTALSFSDGGAMDFHGISMVDSSFGCIVGTNKGVVITHDGGTTWSGAYTNPGLSLNAVVFIDRQTGYAAGDGGLIMSTINGGIDWSEENAGTLEKLFGLYVCGNKNVFAVGNGGIILKKTPIVAIAPAPLSRFVLSSKNPAKFIDNNRVYIGFVDLNHQTSGNRAVFDLQGRIAGQKTFSPKKKDRNLK